jgi:quercetin dioxygenase-like cupin family protein
MIEGKVWGETECVFSSESVTVHHLKIKRGGYSSKHRHEFKGNVFHLLRGRVVIREWQGEGPKPIVDETVLLAGQRAGVSPQVWHQFEALEDSEMIEVYIAALQGADINREGQGGLRCEAEIKASKKRSE